MAPKKTRWRFDIDIFPPLSPCSNGVGSCVEFTHWGWGHSALFVSTRKCPHWLTVWIFLSCATIDGFVISVPIC